MAKNKEQWKNWGELFPAVGQNRLIIKTLFFSITLFKGYLLFYTLQGLVVKLG